MRRAVVAHHVHGLHPEQRTHVLLRLGGRRRGDREHGLPRKLARTDPPQPPQHRRDVAPERALVHVALVNHDVAQVGEEALELPVDREHALVEHVGVGHEQTRAAADGGPGLLGGVAIVHVDRRGLGGEGGVKHALQRGALVLSERLGGEHEERACLWVLREALQTAQGPMRAGRAHMQLRAGEVRRLPRGRCEERAWSTAGCNTAGQTVAGETTGGNVRRPWCVGSASRLQARVTVRDRHRGMRGTNARVLQIAEDWM